MRRALWARVPAVRVFGALKFRVLAGALTCWAGALTAEPLALTTDLAVHMAMQDHESIEIARSEVVSARAQMRVARADGLADVTTTFDYTRNWLLPSIQFNDTAVKIGSDNEMVGRVTLRQPLYTGGLVGGAVQASQGLLTMAAEAERFTLQGVRAAVETAMYDYLLAAEMARVRYLALDRARANQGQVAAMRQAGKATRFDWARAQVQVANGVADSIEGAHEVTLAGLDVRDAIGVDMSQEIVVQATFRDNSALLSAQNPLQGNLENIVTRALQARPERRRAQALASSHEGDEQSARAGVRPRLDLLATGQMQFQDDAFTDVGQGDAWRRSWSTGIRLEVPLFDGMRSKARVAQAREARRRVQLQVEQLDRTIEQQVRRAWMELTAADKRLQAYLGTVAQAQIGLDDAAARYRVGAGTQLEVLDAQLVLLQSESEVARAHRDRAVALVGLEWAAGILGE